MAVSKNTREYIFNRDDNQCLRCWATDNLTVDHVIPLALGGSNLRTNMQTLCWQCNQDKGENVVDYRWVEDMPESCFHFEVEIEVQEIYMPLSLKDAYRRLAEKIKQKRNNNPFAEPKNKKLKQIVKELGFYDNPVTLERDIYLQHQTPEQFKIAKQHGWRFAKMITEPTQNFHYDQ